MMVVDRQQNKKPSDGQILGYNVLVFIAYTIICMAVDNSGAVVAFFISIAHFLICCVIAIITRRLAWVLGGFLVMLIGFGTCVGGLFGQ